MVTDDLTRELERAVHVMLMFGSEHLVRKKGHTGTEQNLLIDWKYRCKVDPSSPAFGDVEYNRDASRRILTSTQSKMQQNAAKGRSLASSCLYWPREETASESPSNSGSPS